MFDDIVTDKKLIKKISLDEACPYCRSTKVDSLDGVFVRAGLYVHTVQCVVCKEKWSLTYDSDLNIIEVILGV